TARRRTSGSAARPTTTPREGRRRPPPSAGAFVRCGARRRSAAGVLDAGLVVRARAELVALLDEGERRGADDDRDDDRDHQHDGTDDDAGERDAVLVAGLLRLVVGHDAEDQADDREAAQERQDEADDAHRLAGVLALAGGRVRRALLRGVVLRRLRGTVLGRLRGAVLRGLRRLLRLARLGRAVGGRTRRR